MKEEGGTDMRGRKFNPKKCEKCIYHGYFGAKSETNQNLCCDYSVLAHDGAALQNGRHGQIEDRRGNDPNGCKLFKEGKKLEAFTMNI